MRHCASSEGARAQGRASSGCYPHELWTTRLLARHVREHGPRAGHECLATLAQGALRKILSARAVKPHKVRYYLERRDPDFEAKMAEVLCVYREVELLKQSEGEQAGEAPAMAIVSYDEKPGMQAIGPLRCKGSTPPIRRPPRSHSFPTIIRRTSHGRPARGWPRSPRAASPSCSRPSNLVEGFFSKLARSVRRHIRVASKQELKDRIMAVISTINRDPVVHTCTYSLSEAA